MAPKDEEYEGKSVDAAVEEACNALNLDKEKLKYDVLSYGSTGIFGIVGAKKARIRVRNSVSHNRASGNQRPAKAGAQVSEEPQNPRETIAAEDSEIPDPLAGEGDKDRPTLAEMESAAEEGNQCLRKIIDAITDEATISSELESESIRFEIHGGNAAVLIGKRGQTLEAVQYLVDKMVNRKAEGRIRIVVDVEGYWENRRSSLKEMAKRMAGKSKKTGKPITLGQMNAHDRRIVHLTLKDDPHVKTQSRGEGFFRKLIIFPKKAPSPRRQKQEE